MILGKMKTYMIIILMGLIPIVFMKGCEFGEDREELKQFQAIKKLRKTMLKQHKISFEKINNKNTELKSRRRISDAKIGKLLKENAILKDWWDTDIPGDINDYIYGMRNPKSDERVPSR